MRHKSIIICLSITLSAFLNVQAQEKDANFIDSAMVYYEKKDFKKAAHFFDVYYLEQKKAQSNYNTYFAAVAAASAGNMERAAWYLQRSAAIGYDLSAYQFFAEDPNNAALRDLPQWKAFLDNFKTKADSAKVIMDKTIAEINDYTYQPNESRLNDRAFWEDVASKSSVDQLIKKIKEFNDFDAPGKDNFWTLYRIKANDSLTVPFMVYVPKGYRASQKTPLYVYLHGAIIARKEFTKPEYIPGGLETSVLTGAMEQNAFIIYPLGKKDFGWLYQQQAFETILKEINLIKSNYNIDDNRIFVGGHSNGGSGAFWFSIKQPSAFAGFFGLNYLPKAYFGNTTLGNLKNVTPFFGVSGSDDTTFPWVTVNSIYQYGLQHGANWKNVVRKGGHSLPFTNRDTVNFVFDSLATKIRDPFPRKISWETDDVKNGRYAWLEIKELDTLADRASWHQELNPEVTQGGKTGTVDFNKHRAGAVRATCQGNTIYVETSRVKRIKIYLSPDMFRFNEQIKLIINGKQHLYFKHDMSKDTIVDEFLKTRDRSVIVADVVELTVN